MEYNFDKALNRSGTYSMKYDDDGYFKRLVPEIRLDQDSLRLMIADMDFQGPPAVIKAMHRVADHGTYGYTTADAAPEFRGSIIRWYQKRYQFQLKPEWIVYSAGALDGVGRVITAFSDPGDGVIICCPVYSNFTTVIHMHGRKVVNCQKLQESLGDYRMDWEKFEELCAVPENKVFVLCSPENPVGRVWEREELVRMAAICKAHDVILVSDEIHSDIVRAGIRHWPILQAVEDHSNLVMVSGTNKSFNQMGLQCAYSVIPDDALRAKFTDGYIATMPTPFALAGMIAAYDESEDWLNALNAYLDEGLVYVVGYMKKKLPLVRAYVPQGTYVIWVDFAEYEQYGINPMILQYLVNHKANVTIQGGLSHDPQCGGMYLRFALTSPKAVVAEAIDRIDEAFEAFLSENLK